MRRFVTNTLLVTGSLLLALLLAEGVCRWIFPESMAPKRGERTAFWQYDSVLGWRHRPGQTGRLRHPAFTIDVSINRHGLRDDDYPLARTEKRRLLVLGDSFAWGYGVQLEQRFSEILERAAPRWEVINAGVSGYGTDQSLLYFGREGYRFKPDGVLLLLFYNDFDDNISQTRYWYNKPVFREVEGQWVLQNVPVPRASWGQKAERWILGSTWFVSRLYRVTKGLLGIEASVAGAVNVNPKQLDQYGPLKRRTMAALLSRLHQRIRSQGAWLMVAVIPRGMPRENWQLLRQVADQEGFDLLDLSSSFPVGEPGLYIPGDGHWTAKGHRKAAHRMLRALQPFGVNAQVADDYSDGQGR